MPHWRIATQAPSLAFVQYSMIGGGNLHILGLGSIAHRCVGVLLKAATRE